MKKILFVFLTLFIAFTFNVYAQGVTITGDDIIPITLTKAMFANMKQVVVMAKAHDEKVHRYSGVPLTDILAKAGVMMGDSAKKKTIMTYIVVTAADNYKAIYTLPEIDLLFANRTIILADRTDKKPLPSESGPFQIIVPGEKKHARWMRQVTSIHVVRVK
ncbi:molybdopterin-dependent oxidoreductase [Mucilaginibacter terrae]|uniref:molybdopterin-dependent oxidoreductase n=1 Tax=Mucilaginibacter terrae TaxID=1955052 RepID=UPI0036393AA4